MPITVSSAVQQLSNGSTTGTVLGYNTTPISFFGGTPAAQALQGSLKGVNGNVTLYSTTQSPTSIAANTVAEQTLTVTGIASTDFVVAVKPTSQAGLAVCSARASAANTVAVAFANVTAAGITPTASELWTFIGIAQPLVLTQSLSPAVVASNTTAEQQFTVTGIVNGMAVAVNKPTTQAGLGVVGARVIAANTIGITFLNATGAAITPTAAETYKIFGAVGMQPSPVMTTITAALTPVSVAANTTAEQTFTVAGLVSGTQLFVDKPSVQPGLALDGARVSATNTLALNYINATTSPITPTAETYTIGYFPAAAPAAGSSLITDSVMGASPLTVMNQLGLVG